MFFKPPAPLPCEPLVYSALSLQDVALTLIGAQVRGAVVGSEFLTGIIERSDSVSLWEGYVWLGRTDAEYVLKNTLRRSFPSPVPHCIIFLRRLYPSC